MAPSHPECCSGPPGMAARSGASGDWIRPPPGLCMAAAAAGCRTVTSRTRRRRELRRAAFRRIVEKVARYELRPAPAQCMGTSDEGDGEGLREHGDNGDADKPETDPMNEPGENAYDHSNNEEDDSGEEDDNTVDEEPKDPNAGRTKGEHGSSQSEDGSAGSSEPDEMLFDVAGEVHEWLGLVSVGGQFTSAEVICDIMMKHQDKLCQGDVERLQEEVVDALSAEVDNSWLEEEDYDDEEGWHYRKMCHGSNGRHLGIT